MAHDLRAHLGIDRQMVIPDAGWPNYVPWANGEEFYLSQWEVQKDDLGGWVGCDQIDTLIAIETGFGDQTFKWAKEYGMRTALIVMWEAFNPNLPAYQNVDLYVCPSFKAFQEVPFDNRVFLPYPIDTEEFPFVERTGPAKTFIHNAGSGGMYGRKGTRETIEAFIRSGVSATLIVRCQRPLHEICGLDGAVLPQNIKVDYGSKPTRAELYTYGDVMIYPSAYDGHALVTLEAMAAGMPVIVTDAEPMNEYWPSGQYELAVKVAERQHVHMVNPHCLAHRVDIDDLAAKIRWCTENDMGPISRNNRAIAQGGHSWAILKNRWKQRLGIR